MPVTGKGKIHDPWESHREADHTGVFVLVPSVISVRTTGRRWLAMSVASPALPAMGTASSPDRR